MISESTKKMDRLDKYSDKSQDGTCYPLVRKGHIRSMIMHLMGKGYLIYLHTNLD